MSSQSMMAITFVSFLISTGLSFVTWHYSDWKLAIGIWFISFVIGMMINGFLNVYLTLKRRREFMQRRVR